MLKIIMILLYLLTTNPKGDQPVKVSLSSKILLWVLYIFMAIVVLLLVSLPFMLDEYILEFDPMNLETPGYKPFITSFLVVFALEAMWIIFELIILVRSVPADPFTNRNVNALRRIGFAAVAAVITIVVKCIFYFTIMTLVITFILLLGALGAFTLADLFSKAVIFKEENELTI